MINKKILSIILCVVFVLSTTVSVSALTFSDVENDPTVSWAKPYINSMADAGYLKGYEDGTFKPNNTISKTEALILLSRMIGVNDSRFEDSVEYAVAENEDVLSKYSTNYKNEVSFLLYTGVLKADELDTYLSASNKNSALLRYEAAILLTKLLGAEDEVKNNAFVSSSYADTVEIPDYARAYVEYVKDAGIMQGMGNNAQGKPEFWPNTAVTRSQMAKMLYSLIDVLDVTVDEGVIVLVDDFEETVTITADNEDIVLPIEATTKFKINGEDATMDDLTIGMEVKVTHLADKVKMIENNVTVENAVIYGLVSSTAETGGKKTVTIADANDKTIIKTYTLDKNAKIRVDGAIDLFSKIKKTNYVALTIVDGLVAELDVIDKNTTAGGTLVSVDASGEYTILNVKDSVSGEAVKYEISADGVQVSRNSRDSQLSELMNGDTLSLRLTYGKVTKISASSKNSTVDGTISYITHSTTGTVIGIEADRKVTEYKVNKSVTIVIDSTEEGTVYDLRPGTDVSVNLQSSEIISVEAAGSISKSQLNGTVKSINTTYGLMIVEENGTEYSVYVNGNTKIIDSTTGRTLLLKSVGKGKTVTITGSSASGVFEASVIVIH